MSAAGDSGLPGIIPTDPPRPVPDLAFVDGEGRRVDLADFGGRVVVLNVWATWCGPCVREMPSLDRLEAALGGRDFQVVALSVDRGGAATVAPFLPRLRLSALRPYYDPLGESMEAFGIRGLPTSILIDREGREVGRVEGAIAWDAPAARRLIERVIGRSGPKRDSGLTRTGGRAL